MIGEKVISRNLAHPRIVSLLPHPKTTQTGDFKEDGAGKAFADHMVEDHTKTIADPTAAAKTENISPFRPRLNGGDFAKQYFKDQVSAHKTAVNLFDRYGKGGKDAKLKDWGSQTLPTLKEHLKMAQVMDK